MAMSSGTIASAMLFRPDDTTGLFPVRVSRVLEAAEGIRAIELVRPNGGDLPAWQPGAHIDVFVNDDITRQYSMCGDVEQADVWRVGVLREPSSRGGSEAIHASLQSGDTLWVSEPKNNFEFSQSQRYLFIGGGIGITPLLPMIRACANTGADWRLVYGGRSLSSMAFRDELAAYGDRVLFWPQDENGHIDIVGLLDGSESGTGVYCCGPGPLLDAVEQRFELIPSERDCRLHLERFQAKAPPPGVVNLPFTVLCDYSDLEVEVGADETILEAVERAGVEVPSSCREGTCGTCETAVFEGIPDHRDSYLTKDEQASNEVMTPCCSRSKTPVIVLDL